MLTPLLFCFLKDVIGVSGSLGLEITLLLDMVLSFLQKIDLLDGFSAKTVVILS